MKLRLLVIALAAATLTLVGCGDDITNFIEDSATPTQGTPPTSAPATNTPVPPTSAVATNTPTPDGQPTNTPPIGSVCGNGTVELPETCDDGGICANDTAVDCDSPTDCGGADCLVNGGDGCAANCTLEVGERRLSAAFAPGSGSTVQTALFPISISLQGTQTVQAGDIRDDTVVDVNGNETFQPGDIPFSVKADDVDILPVIVTSLVCACVRGIEVPIFGEGNSANGRVACGDNAADFDYLLTQDHNTNGPLSSGMRDLDCAQPLDPECDDSVTFPSGVVSESCEEGTDPGCSDSATNIHTGVCNSPRNIEFGGGPAPRGSAIINNNTAIGLLSDGGRCDMTIAGMSPCPQLPYGPDCIPCTDDDLDFGNPENIPTTTGTAKAAVYNALNTGGRLLEQGSITPCTGNADCTLIDDCGNPETCIDLFGADGMPTGDKACGVRCGGRLCFTQMTGAPFDCDKLLGPDPSSGLSGGGLAVSFPSIDANLIQDNVTATKFLFE